MTFMSAVYLPIELTRREYDGKLLLAAYLSERGCNIVFGEYSQLVEHAHKNPYQSVFFAKDCQSMSYPTKQLDTLQARGWKIVVQDEEAGVTANDFEPFYRERIRGDLSRFDRFYAWGDHDFDFLASQENFDPAKIRKTGSPRTVLWGGLGRSWFKQEITSITKKQPYILFATNFGPSAIGGDKPSARERDLIDSYTRLVRRISSLQEFNVIFRPHPAAEDDFWRQKFSKLANVFVISQGSLTPYVLSASAVVQSFCTSGLEAAIARVPVITFSNHYDATANFSVAPIQDTEEKVFNILSNLDEQEGRLDSQQMTARRRFFGAGKLEPIDLIGSDVTALYKDLFDVSGARQPEKSQRLNAFRAYYRYCIDYRRARHFNKRLKKEKYRDFSLRKLRIDLARAYRLLNLKNVPPRPEEIMYRTFLIKKSEAR